MKPPLVKTLSCIEPRSRVPSLAHDRPSSPSNELVPLHLLLIILRLCNKMFRAITQSYCRFHTSAARCFAPSHPESLAITHTGRACAQISNLASELLTRTYTSPPCSQIGIPVSAVQTTQPIAVPSQLSLAMSHNHDCCLFHTSVPRSQHKALALHKSLASSCVSCSTQVLLTLSQHVHPVLGWHDPLTSSLSRQTLRLFILHSRRSFLSRASHVQVLLIILLVSLRRNA